MTNELEKQFFDTFGIEPRCIEFDIGASVNAEIFEYPNVTNTILVKLICIIGSIYICAQDRETLKEHILVQCMNTQMHGRDIKHQVRTLFKEG